MGGSGASLLYTATVFVMMGLEMALSPVAAAAGSFSDEVAALMAVKAALRDPGSVLGGWDPAVSGGDNPCNWTMVYCHRGRLYELNLRRKNLSGELSPAIGRLTSLRFLLLSHNAISGPIPDTIGGMQLLQRLDLSYNQFNGSIPSTLGGLMKLQYLELNSNNLSGPIPDSLATAHKIFGLDLSYNNLSGPRPMFRASVVTLEGNPLLRGINCTKSEPGLGNPLSGGNCSYVTAEQDDHPSLILSPTKTPANKRDTKEEKMCIVSIIVPCISVVSFFIISITGLVLLLRRGHHQPPQVFAVVDDATSAISITDSGLSQYSFSSVFILP